MAVWADAAKQSLVWCMLSTKLCQLAAVLHSRSSCTWLYLGFGSYANNVTVRKAIWRQAGTCFLTATVMAELLVSLDLHRSKLPDVVAARQRCVLY